MLERSEHATLGIDVLKAAGTVSKNDYRQVVEPLIEDARREGRRIRILCEFGPEFRRFTPGAAWEDLKVGLGSIELFEGCAVVTDTGWIREPTRLMSFLMPCPVRLFGAHQREGAFRWLASLPEGAGISHRLTDSGVLVVEVSQPLRAADFDTLGSTMDSRLGTPGGRTGVVLHAAGFPGWENGSSLVRHVRFVRDHRRVIGKVALAADGKVASLLPRLANRFVRAEVRRFGHEELDSAVAWAAAPSTAPKGVGASPGQV
ncbi:STAS/SEC14 domain-containing protein [Streptomyces sp. NPDC049949]|uniref:STAS/SEC14 domain-containing protein n=1 Tax=Streptomyces sp. NPDC049949 TaxID=3154627 RepID=UPI0034183AA3